MALSKSRIEARLKPILKANIDAAVIDDLVEEDFLEIFNETANDLNSMAMIHIKKLNFKTGDDNAEANSNNTNYLAEGIIEKILYFNYLDSTWEDQFYTFKNDRIAFKTKPNDGVELTIDYLIKPEAISADTDEIDLPEEIESDYLDLTKYKILTRYGKIDDEVYEDKLLFYSDKANKKVNKPTINKGAGIAPYWFHQCGDETVYDITHNFISLGNFVENASGQLIYVDA